MQFLEISTPCFICVDCCSVYHTSEGDPVSITIFASIFFFPIAFVITFYVKNDSDNNRLACSSSKSARRVSYALIAVSDSRTA